MWAWRVPLSSRPGRVGVLHCKNRLVNRTQLTNNIQQMNQPQILVYSIATPSTARDSRLCRLFTPMSMYDILFVWLRRNTNRSSTSEGCISPRYVTSARCAERVHDARSRIRPCAGLISIRMYALPVRGKRGRSRGNKYFLRSCAPAILLLCDFPTRRHHRLQLLQIHTTCLEFAYASGAQIAASMGLDSAIVAATSTV